MQRLYNEYDISYQFSELMTRSPDDVMPAKAGIHAMRLALSGACNSSTRRMAPRLRGGDKPIGL